MILQGFVVTLREILKTWVVVRFRGLGLKELGVWRWERSLLGKPGRVFLVADQQILVEKS